MTGEDPVLSEQPVARDTLPRDVPAWDLERTCRAAVTAGARVQFAYAWFPEGVSATPGTVGESAEHAGARIPELRYVIHTTAGHVPEIWRCNPGTLRPPSLAAIAPLVSWYEREITDLCGLGFEDQPQPEPLVLLPGAHAARPPLQPGIAPPLSYRPQPHSLPEIAGSAHRDVQLLPFGPIRADVFESAQFTFVYIGEAILHYQPQLFFKYRGMEKRFEGVAPELGVVLAERVSAVGSVAHALAYSHALESAARCEVPPRAEWLRVLLAELERLYNHLHYLGHLCHTTTLKVGEAEGKYLEELAKQMNADATGSRFLRSLVCPGGMRREPGLAGIARSLRKIEHDFTHYAQMLESTSTHLDRLITTGLLSKQLAFDLGATGPIERASGVDRDPRRDQPYSVYEQLPLRVAVREGCDAHARQQVRIAEALHSIELIRAVVEGLPAGPICVPCRPFPHSEGLGWAESPRGLVYYAVHVDAAGRLGRVKIKSPSFSNWRVFPYTVHDTNMMDYAINEASFGLTIAGCAR
jgi:Ni,Fe-hydrogenase III large subunit